jgi:predicted phage terminase large subunit-like protein
MHAAHGHWAIHGDLVPRLAHEIVLPGEHPQIVAHKNRLYNHRAKSKFGLIEHVRAPCQRYQVDRLLIEAKGPGISIGQEFARLYSSDGLMVEMINPKGDKIARAHAVVPLFANNLVWAPDRDWAEMAIAECSVFPKGKRDDLVDSTTQALQWYRNNNLLRTGVEDTARENEAQTFRSRSGFQSVWDRYFGHRV